MRIDSQAIRLRWEADGSKRDERGKRLFAASEVRAAGYGGLAAVARITSIARSTIERGLDDLDAPPLPPGRVRGWLKADILKGTEKWTPVQGSPRPCAAWLRHDAAKRAFSTTCGDQPAAGQHLSYASGQGRLAWLLAIAPSRSS